MTLVPLPNHANKLPVFINPYTVTSVLPHSDTDPNKPMTSVYTSGLTVYAIDLPVEEVVQRLTDAAHQDSPILFD